MWKKEVKQTHTEQDQVEDRLKISRVPSLSLSVALTVAARQPPLWPGQDNRAQAAPKTKPKQKQKQKQHQNPSEPLPFGFIVHAV